MKVTFKLTPRQLKKALEIATNVALENGAEEIIAEDRGNLLRRVELRPGYNRDQSLSLDGKTQTVTYEGCRHPLVVDGGLAVLEKISEGNIRNLRMVEYITTSPRLFWYETESQYLTERANYMALSGYINDVLIRKRKLLWGLDIVKCEAFRLTDIDRAVADMRKPDCTDARLFATYDAGTVAMARKIVKIESQL